MENVEDSAAFQKGKHGRYSKLPPYLFIVPRIQDDDPSNSEQDPKNSGRKQQKGTGWFQERVLNNRSHSGYHPAYRKMQGIQNSIISLIHRLPESLRLSRAYCCTQIPFGSRS